MNNNSISIIVKMVHTLFLITLPIFTLTIVKTASFLQVLAKVVYLFEVAKIWSLLELQVSSELITVMIVIFLFIVKVSLSFKVVQTCTFHIFNALNIPNYGVNLKKQICSLGITTGLKFTISLKSKVKSTMF